MAGNERITATAHLPARRSGPVRQEARVAITLTLIAVTLLLAGCGAGPGVAAQMAPQPPATADADRGARAFESYGCDSCHATQAGAAGLSLAGLAEAEYIADGKVPHTRQSLAGFIRNPRQVYPETTMPNLGVSAADADDIVAYLYSLAVAVDEPVVAIAPETGPPGVRVNVRAEGFPPGAEVEIDIGRFGTYVDRTVSGRTDAEGKLVAQATIPPYAAAGQHWVVVVRGKADEEIEARSNVFTVSEAARRPTVSLSPGLGPPGAEVQVEGRGFPASAAVSAGFARRGEDPRSTQRGRTDAQGRLSLRLRLPDEAQPGESWVAVIGGARDGVSATSAAFTVVEPEAEARLYVVRQGDTLGAIARRFGTSIAAIVAANPDIGDPNRLSIGQRLRLPGEGATTAGLLLPDLRPLPPESLYIEQDEAAGVRNIRFSSTVVNVGDGPLVLHGEYDPQAGRNRVSQQMETAEGLLVERFVGYFIYHAEHRHWHFEDFNSFELWSYDADGELDSLITTTGKMTFCIHDLAPMASPPANAAAEPQYAECGRAVQGISVGWADTYDPQLPGQELDIAGLPDGRYAIRTTVNPDGNIAEVDQEDNSVVIYVAIRGQEIEVLEGP